MCKNHGGSCGESQEQEVTWSWDLKVDEKIF